MIIMTVEELIDDICNSEFIRLVVALNYKFESADGVSVIIITTHSKDAIYTTISGMKSGEVLKPLDTIGLVGKGETYLESLMSLRFAISNHLQGEWKNGSFTHDLLNKTYSD